MKCVRCYLVLLAGVLVLAVAFISLGLAPVKASSGHLPPTAWLLEFAMERAVSTNSLGIKAPSQDDEALVMRGAGHFEVGCAWCHGRPGTAPGRIVTQMTPHPSVLDEELAQWSAEELFTIVRHGVKFTGMPAWPAAQRDDEVWAMVAFLNRYQSLDLESYRQLAGLQVIEEARHQNRVSPPAPHWIIDRCIACHGLDGQGRSAFPSLAGQKSAYLVQALESYRTGTRPSGTMGPLAAHLTDKEIAQAAEFFSQQSSRQKDIRLSDKELAMAQDLIDHGDPRRRIGACGACHPSKPNAFEVSYNYPVLAGQRVDYLIGQLYLFRQGTRGGGSQHHIMHNLAEELTNEQIRAVARFYGSARDSLADSSDPLR